MNFQIKNRWTGNLQFECELDASLKAKSFGVQLGAAIKMAVAARANLAGANLDCANLAGANLADANLAGANLARANLTDANLADANLADANLAGANLARANLAGAYLAGANLTDAKWTNAIVLSMQPIQVGGLTYFAHAINGTHLHIGCELHTVEEWEAFGDDEIVAMDGRRALTFWRQWKEPLLALVRGMVVEAAASE